MLNIGDTIRVKSIAAICRAHNVGDIKDIADYGPGWDMYMDSLCGNTYEITGIDPNRAGGDWYSIKDQSGIEWWLIEEWFSDEEITKPMKPFRKSVCRHHDQPTGIIIENVMLLDHEPIDHWSKNAESRLYEEAIENAARQLKYRLRSWPICGNGGNVELWGYLDRQVKSVDVHWCCSCQDDVNSAE